MQLIWKGRLTVAVIGTFLSLILFSGCKSTVGMEPIIVGHVGKPGVADATIFICDAKSGIPLYRTSFGDFLCVNSDKTGRFCFTNVPPGTYRLVAQSWPGLERPKTRQKTAINIPPAENVLIHGTAENIKVPSRVATHVVIRPLGTGKITLDQKFPNDAGYVLISTKPLVGDPILGFLAWNDEFLSHLVGVGCIPNGKTITMTGLPDKNLQTAIFVNDDSPGFGSAFYATLPTTPQKLPIVAGWSDAQHEPPPNIRHIMDVLKEHKTSAGELLKIKKPQAREYAAQLQELKAELGPLDRVVDLPGGEKATVADVFATIGYTRLLEGERKRNR